MLRYFQEGGVFMYAVALFGGVAIIVGLIAIIVALTSRSRGLTLALGAVTLLTSVTVALTAGVGYASSMSHVHAAIAGASLTPDQNAQLLAVGTEESMHVVVLGALCAGVPFLLAAATLVRALVQPRAATAGRDPG
jgi:hypothetical protein